MSFLLSALLAPKPEPETDPDPLFDFVICDIKQEPQSDDEFPDLHSEQHNSQTGAEQTSPDDYRLLKVKEESYDLEIFEEPEFKYDVTKSIVPDHCEESSRSLFKCDQCHRCFKTKRQITKHVKFHLKTGSFHPISENPLMSFPKTHKTDALASKRKPTPKLKQRCSTENRTFSCEDCGKVYKRSFNLANHRRSPCLKESLQCEICLRHFNNRSTLEGHLRIHTGERPFQCEICNKGFKWIGDRNSHQRAVHMNIKNHKCEVCEKSFFLKGGLKQHMLTHTGEKPFPCEICGARYTQKSRLTMHERRHRGARQYKAESWEETIQSKIPLYN